MFTPPPIPPWDALHPLIIHFPIALLLVAPVFILAAIIAPRTISNGFALSALVLMTLGVIAAFVAVSTGEAAGALVDRSSRALNEAVERHEELAENARTIFSVLLGIFVLVVIGPMVLGKKAPRPRHVRIAYAVFLLAYAPATLVLANAAHRGGLLVHEFGVHALLPAPDAPLPPAAVGDDAD